VFDKLVPPQLMDDLARVLRHWDACEPIGVLLPANRLSKIFELVSQHLNDSSLSAAAHTDASALLSVAGDGLPPFLRLLRISGSRKSRYEVIHFFRFWQAFEELGRRLCGAKLQGVAERVEENVEPLAEEIIEFRDSLLRKFGHGSVTQSLDGFVTSSTLKSELLRMQSMSADTSAWVALESDIFLCGSRPAQEMPLHRVFEIVLAWLRKVCESYVGGLHDTRIRSVGDVISCGRRDSCLHLSHADWDVEDALLGFFSGQVPGSIARAGASTSWSSCGAKLQKLEVECPICMNPYSASDGSFSAGSDSGPVELRCCFQVLCRLCHRKLLNDQRMITCPFCRVIDRVPLQPVQAVAHPRSSSLGRICRTAERLASGASRSLRAGGMRLA